MSMTQRTFSPVALTVLGLAVGACFLLTPNEAGAKGCNGVVDQLKWGCAAWDNNNGPQFPHYKKPKSSQPAARIAPAPTPQVQRPVIAPNSGNRLVGQDGAGVISRDGAGIISRDGAGVRGK